MNCLIIDNYDSFTYNLYQDSAKILASSYPNSTVAVIRNDEYDLAYIKAQNYDRIIISPGPGNPENTEYFGICSKVICELGKTTPILGVCLGMQGIGYCFGAKVIPAHTPMHGYTSQITHDGQGIFNGIPEGIEVMRYHSLIVEESSLPEELVVTATDTTRGAIMGLRHRFYPIQGVQFHPESFASEGGYKLLENFIKGEK